MIKALFNPRRSDYSCPVEKEIHCTHAQRHTSLLLVLKSVIAYYSGREREWGWQKLSYARRASCHGTTMCGMPALCTKLPLLPVPVHWAGIAPLLSSYPTSIPWQSPNQTLTALGKRKMDRNIRSHTRSLNLAHESAWGFKTSLGQKHRLKMFVIF